jgi:anti-sigma B factor antagonist
MTRIGIGGIPEPLRTTRYRHGDTMIVIASGEIDLSSADRLRTELGELLGSCRRLVLDLGHVDFIESSGLHCILDIEQASRARGVEFALVPGPPQVQRLFDITRTAERLRFIEPIPRRGAPYR